MINDHRSIRKQPIGIAGRAKLFKLNL